MADMSVEQLAEIERTESIPWNLSVNAIAKLACIYRVHIADLETLTRNSFDLALISGHLPDQQAASLQVSKWLSKVRAALKRAGAKDLIT